MLSGAAEPNRAARAMAAVEEYLVRRGQELVLLFTPPFDRAPLDPGYIKGYPPGVRENGGQYTHAAIWSVMAFAALGDGDKANELFSILNPINRASTRAGVHRYKVEPYVAAADVYAESPHVGRGGWTWYTGSAGWMYRAGIEWLLGFRLRGAVLHLDPCIPRAWRRFEIAFRYHGSRYEIMVENPRGVSRGVAQIEVDGRTLGVRQHEPPVERGWRDASSARHPGVTAAPERCDARRQSSQGSHGAAVFGRVPWWPSRGRSSLATRPAVADDLPGEVSRGQTGHPVSRRLSR